MPLYEYSCRQCDHAFEALVFDGESVECPECHGRRLERQWSVPAKPRARLRPCGCPDAIRSYRPAGLAVAACSYQRKLARTSGLTICSAGHPPLRSAAIDCAAATAMSLSDCMSTPAV